VRWGSSPLFVGDEERRQRCAQQLSSRKLSFYLCSVGLFATNAGEFTFALRFFECSAEIDRAADDKVNLSIDLRNQSELLTVQGALAEAERTALEALALAREIKQDTAIRNSLCYLADAQALEGRNLDALAAFDEANKIEKRTNPDGDELFSLRGVQWAHLLLRLHRVSRARGLTEANLKICERNRWHGDVARCRWILGRADTADGRYDNAVEHLAAAEAAFRRASMVSWLPRVLLARADLERQRQRWDDGEGPLDEALRLAAPRQMRLDHADALALRGRLRLDRARASGADQQALRDAGWGARDDAEAALAIARDCGYAWAERDALTLLAEACEILDDREAAVRYRRDAKALSARLADPGDPPQVERPDTVT
jgi:tetratricopeptide (TPR) repeat protein